MDVPMTERCADTIDAAAEVTQLVTDIGIQSARAALNAKPKYPFKGRCYNCDEPLTEGPFCDSDCRDDLERITENRKGFR